jgi:hypothetical protein
VFATYPANICHMAPVPAHRQPALPGDLTLLLGAHGGKPTPALLGTSALGFAPSRPPRRLATVLSTPGLRAAAITARALLAAPPARLVLLVEVFAHASPAATGSAPGGALTIRFLGADARSFGIVFANTLGSTPGAARFRNGERALIAVRI